MIQCDTRICVNTHNQKKTNKPIVHDNFAETDYNVQL